MSNCSWFYDNIHHAGTILLCVTVYILLHDLQFQFPGVEFILVLLIHLVAVLTQCMVGISRALHWA